VKKTKAKPEENYFLTINRCPSHGGYWSVGIDLICTDNTGIGTRLTPSKCCGAWDTVRKWKLSSEDWDQIIKEAKLARRFAARQEAKMAVVQTPIDTTKIPSPPPKPTRQRFPI
jgi:hypothetical protein